MVLAWDTETRNFRWWENPAFLASWVSSGASDSWGESSHVAALPNQGQQLLGALASHTSLVGHNAKFDAHMTRESIGFDVLDPAKGYTVHDTATMSRLVNGSREPFHGLKELAVKHIDPTADEGEERMEKRHYELTGHSNMSQDDTYWHVWNDADGRDLVETYAATDAKLTLKLYELLAPQIASDAKLAKLYKLETQVQTVLYEAEKMGVAIDQEQVTRLDEGYGAREAAARRDLQRELGCVPEGTGSDEALREALPRAGVKLTERTEKTGELAVNRRALAAYADHPAVKALFEFRRVNKFRKTYLGPLYDHDVVHTNFKQSEAWTGRMAAAQPNLQNLPKRTEKSLENELKVRSVFVPRDGYEFVVSDYESIEVKVLAHHLGFPEYKELVRAGDPHAITASAAVSVLGIHAKPEDFYKGTEMRWLRDIAKNCTYGIVYGGGGPVIRDTWNRMVIEAGQPQYVIDLDQARAIRRQITDTIPGFKAFTASPYKGRSYPRGALYAQLLASQSGDYGYVRTLGGRKQWIKLDKAYVALSGLIQGGAADIMKMAAVNVHEALKPHGGYPLLFVHDEMVNEVPKGWGERLTPIIEEAMVDAFPLDPALTVESTVTDRSYAHV